MILIECVIVEEERKIEKKRAYKNRSSVFLSQERFRCMGISDFNIKDLFHKVRSIMAELRTPPSKSPMKIGLSSAERLTCYDFAMEIDQDVTESGANTPESDVLRSGRSKVARLSARQLFTSPTPLQCSTVRYIYFFFIL